MAFDISKLNEKLDLAAGEWVGNIDDNPGMRIKVRSQHYKPYKAELDRLNRKSGKKGINDVDFGGLLAKYILLDWDFKGADGPLVLVDKGKPVAYSEELARTILTADDDRGIGAAWRLAVVSASNDIADRNFNDTEEAAGN